MGLVISTQQYYNVSTYFFLAGCKESLDPLVSCVVIAGSLVDLLSASVCDRVLIV